MSTWYFRIDAITRRERVEGHGWARSCGGTRLPTKGCNEDWISADGPNAYDWRRNSVLGPARLRKSTEEREGMAQRQERA